MSDGGQVRPEDAAWVVSVHASEDAEDALGSGIVLDDHRILTCAHVVRRRSDGGVPARDGARFWAAFPMTEEGDPGRRLPVDAVVFPAGGTRVQDLAVLYLAGAVPPGVTAAPLRCPKPGDLRAKRWWAFGFPDGDPIGDSADGLVGESLGHGWIRLDTGSRYPVRPGFSGGGLWSPDYQAVVGVVGQARGDKGDGRAITFFHADDWFPGEKIRSLAERWSATAAGEVALSAWGWSLSDDVEGPRHWRPRARGVSIDSERGHRFHGRAVALQTIAGWLDRAEPDRRVLVITGSPGAGKSAVLGRIVTTADPGAAAQLPPSDTGVRASAGSVACAVHAKGKTALDVAAEIARAASAAIPERIEDFAPALRDALGERRRRFNVIIDALDEVASPAQARAIITRVILPVAETCADVGAQVVVGTRRSDSNGDLLGPFGGAVRLVDLDDAEFFAEADLAAYALATLQLAGDERPGNPYDNEVVAGPVAARIAKLSAGNFLVAGLTARSHGMHDAMAADPAALSFSPNVDDALREYLRRVPLPAGAGAPGVTAETLLTALAFAEAPGLPAGLWRAALRALGAGDVREDVLTRFARSSAASFLVESSGDGGQGTTVRLFHQALNDALLRARARVADRSDDERALTRAFIQVGQDGGWERAPGYLLRSLPVHAACAGLAGDLLADDAYLLHADLRRLLQSVGGTLESAGRDRIRLLRLTSQALDASPAERVAMFSVTEALENLGNAYQDDRWRAPYRARWAAAAPRREQVTCQGHQGGVNAVCAVEVAGQVLLATGSGDGTLRLWDPRTGELVRTLEGHQHGVNAVCAVEVEARALLATSGNDRTVRLWDPRTGELLRTLEGHQHGVRAVCAVEVEGRVLLATGSGDGTVRLWDPRVGEQLWTLEGHQRGVSAVCTVEVEGRVLLATSSGDETARLWDPRTGELVRTLEGHQGRVNAVCGVEVEGRVLLATSSGDETARLWDPRTGELVRTLEGHHGWVWAVCTVEVEGRVLLATGSSDQTARLWSLSDIEQADTHKGHEFGVNGVCVVEVDGTVLLATGSDDRMVRLWDARTGEQVRTLEGHKHAVNAVCGVEVGGRVLLATGSADGTVRLWDPRTGELVRTLEGDHGWVWAVCGVEVGGRVLLAAGADGSARLWDPRTGELVRTLESHQSRVNAVCGVEVGGRVLLAAGADGSARLWDPRTGELVRTLEDHQDQVNAVCTVEVEGRVLLATSSSDRTVRLWHPHTGICQATVPAQHQAVAMTAISGSLAIGMDSGILVIRPGMVN